MSNNIYDAINMIYILGALLTIGFILLGILAKVSDNKKDNK